MSDNGTLFSSGEFKQCAKQYNFIHITGYPRYSHGMVERSVQTIKQLLRIAKAEGKNPYLANLELRNTPVNNLRSSAQLLFGRRTRTLLPRTHRLLQPKTPQNVFKDNKTCRKNIMTKIQNH